MMIRLGSLKGSNHEQANDDLRRGCLDRILAAAFGASADPIAGANPADKWCAECHATRAGRLSPNPAAPTFPQLAAEPSITEYSLRALLRSPHETMPHITFTPDQLDDIIDYIMSLKARK
jgi:mono/diheme cytochrome c family protein